MVRWFDVLVSGGSTSSYLTNQDEVENARKDYDNFVRNESIYDAEIASQILSDTRRIRSNIGEELSKFSDDPDAIYAELLDVLDQDPIKFQALIDASPELESIFEWGKKRDAEAYVTGTDALPPMSKLPLKPLELTEAFKGFIPEMHIDYISPATVAKLAKKPPPPKGPKPPPRHPKMKTTAETRTAMTRLTPSQKKREAEMLEHLLSLQPTVAPLSPPTRPARMDEPLPPPGLSYTPHTPTIFPFSDEGISEARRIVEEHTIPRGVSIADIESIVEEIAKEEAGSGIAKFKKTKSKKKRRAIIKGIAAAGNYSLLPLLLRPN